MPDVRTKRLQVLGDLTPLPKVTEADDGKILSAKGGKWVAIELPKYNGEYEITPSTDSEQTLKTAQTFVDADIKVNKIPYAEVSNTSNGITATIGKEV